MPVIKALLVFPVASLYLTVVPGRVGLDVFHLDAKFLCRSLKRRQPVGLVRAQTVGKLQPSDLKYPRFLSLHHNSTPPSFGLRLHMFLSSEISSGVCCAGWLWRCLDRQARD